MSFVQGQLRQAPLTIAFETECGHCGRSLTMQVDSNLNYQVADETAAPRIFVPAVNFAKLRARSIIDDF